VKAAMAPGKSTGLLKFRRTEEPEPEEPTRAYAELMAKAKAEAKADGTTTEVAVAKIVRTPEGRALYGAHREELAARSA
jgi:spore germination cell wall hydrolase CwlJ-like protein